MSANFLKRFWTLARRPSEIWQTLSVAIRLALMRVFRGRTMILFERHAGIGDIVCTLPSVAAIRAKHPDAYVAYATLPSFTEILSMAPELVNETFAIDRSRPGFRLFYRQFDQAYRLWLEDENPQGRKHVHLVDDFARSLDLQLKSRQPVLSPPDTIARELRDWIKAQRGAKELAIGIQNGPSWPVREWDDSKWDHLVGMLRDRLNAAVFQLGADSNTGTGAQRAYRVKGTLDCVGKWSLVESAAALKAMDLFIGIDSGLLHIAGAVGTPTVGIFGPIDPALRLPPATPTAAVVHQLPCIACHHRQPRLHWITGCPNNIECMKAITPEDVFDACREILNRPEVKSHSMAK